MSVDLVVRESGSRFVSFSGHFSGVFLCFWSGGKVVKFPCCCDWFGLVVC